MSGEHQREQVILEGLRRGDEASLSELMDTYGGRVQAVCSHMTMTREEAEEACHDAFLAAWRGASTFRGESALSTWLYRIAINVCMHRRRSEGRLRKALSSLFEAVSGGRGLVATGGAAGARAGPDRIAEGREEMEITRRALQKVQPEFRAALMLHEWQGLSHAEVASATGVPVGTVKSRIRRGRRALALALRQRMGRRDT